MADSYYGEIQIFAFDYPPYDWQYCNGQPVNVQQNPALFSLIQLYYGGNYQNNVFNLPDLRSRVAIGQGNGPGLTPRIIGQNGGSESTAMTINQMPSHTHQLQGMGGPLRASSQPGTQANPTTTVNTLAGFTEAGLQATNNAYNNGPLDTSLNMGISAMTGAVGNTGQGTAFSTMQPTLGLNYCICVSGYYPQRK